MTEPTTLRDTIEAAIEEPADAPAAAPAPAVEPVAAAQPSAEPTTSSAEPAASPEAAAASQDLNTLAEGGAPEDKPRDEKGKFKNKEEGMTPGPKSGPKQQADRAPASWRPETREHWAQLPEGVRAEVSRREAEVARTLQETAEARKTVEAVMKTIEPYQAFIKAENSNPLQAIDNLMSTAARLRTGTAPELAGLVAGMVNQFGIGRFGNSFVELLDQALAGQTPKVDPQQMAIDQALNQRLAPLQNMYSQFQQAQQAQQMQAAQSAQNEVANFLTRAEFGEDVREEMADLLETAQRRGQNLSLVDAYKKACMLNDRVRTVLRGRAKSRGAQNQTAVAQRARQAAVSVTGAAPAGALRQDPTDVRSAIEAAISMHSPLWIIRTRVREIASWCAQHPSHRKLAGDAARASHLRHHRTEMVRVGASDWQPQGYSQLRWSFHHGFPKCERHRRHHHPEPFASDRGQRHQEQRPAVAPEPAWQRAHHQRRQRHPGRAELCRERQCRVLFGL